MDRKTDHGIDGRQELLTLQEVAKRLRVSLRTARKLAREQIGVVELGKRSIRVRRVDVEKFEAGACALSYGNRTELHPGIAPSSMTADTSASSTPGSTTGEARSSSPDSEPRLRLLRPTQPKTKPRPPSTTR